MTYINRQKAIFIANGLSRLSRDDSWEYLVGLEATLKANKTTPLKAPDWQWAFASMQNDRAAGARLAPTFPRRLAYVEKLFDGVGSENPILLPLIEWTKDVMKEDAVVKRLAVEDAATDSRKRGNVYLQYSPKAVQLLGDLYDVTQESEPAAAYWELHMGRDLGSVKATPEQIVRENPQLQGALDEIDKDVDDSKRAAALKARAAELANQAAQEPNPVIKKQAEPSELAELVEHARETRRQQDAETQRANIEAGLAGAIALYSFFGGNQKTALQLNSVLNAMKNIRQAVDAYNGAMAAGGSQGMAGLALAGAWVSIVTSFSSAFGDDEGPDFETQMREAVSQLSKQLQDIQIQIATSVNYLDKRLGQLSQQIQEGFEAVLTGLAQNQYRLDTLLQTSYAASRTLWGVSQDIVDRVAYKTELDAEQSLEEFVTFKTLNGSGLTQAQLQTLNSKLDFYLRHGRDELISGVELISVMAASTWVRAVELLDEASNWERNLNAYRSLCRALGMPVTPERLCSPRRWRFGASSYIDIRINSTDVPLAANDVLLTNLVLEGQRLTDEVTTLTAHTPGRPDYVDVLVKFLMAEYDQAMTEVGIAVRAVHAGQLAARSSTLLELQEMDVLRREVRDDLRLDPSGLLQGRRVRPSKFEDAVWPEAARPAGAGTEVWDTWALIPGLDVCVPSARRPEKWPELSEEAALLIARSWDDILLENAALAEALGLGTLSAEYQVQVESLQWPIRFSVLLGVPTAYYFLFIKTPNGRKWIAASVSKLRGEAPALSICHESNQPFLSPLGILTDVQKCLLASHNAPHSPPDFEAALAQPNIARSRYTTLENDILSRYALLGHAIRAELVNQLDTPDSPLGRAARRVSRVTDIIRGMCTWLLPEALGDARLRTALYGSTAGWSAWSLRKLDVPEVPLLDLAGFRELVALGLEEEPEDWDEVVTLQPFKQMQVYSANNFVDALRAARATTSTQSSRTEVLETLRELKAVQRFFGTPS